MSSAYTKNWLSIPEQIERLKTYGLSIPDERSAASFLSHINYYRFSGYGLAFEQSRHCFIAGTTFEQIRDTYEFDRSLRDLCTESIEVIELDLRTALAYSFGEKFGPFGHVASHSFYDISTHAQWLGKLREETGRSSEPFVAHYKTRYREYPDLPIWVAAEIMSFGALSKMYRCMMKKDQKTVAARYGLQPETLRSWIHHLVYIRNLCAHHARLWDRIWAIKPHLPAGKAWEPPSLPGNTRLFASLLLQNSMLQHCPTERAFAHDWRRRVNQLLTDKLPTCPNPKFKMDMPDNWEFHPLWRKK
ncbi:MAG: Abi family protein [bacterium]